MGELIVVAGPPGAGKSTVAGLLAGRFAVSALVPGDDFFGFLHNGATQPWLSASHDQNSAVVAAAAAATGRLVAYCDVVYDGVIGPWFTSAFVEFAGVEYLHYVVLLPPLVVCLDRVRTRVGHGFTDLAAAEHMWRDFARAQLAERHRFDEPGDPAEVAERIMQSVADGSLRYPDP